MLREILGLELMKKTVMILLLMGGLLTISHPYARAVSAKEERAEIIEKAKKEGEVVVYSGQTAKDLQDIALVFEKKYPFLKMKAVRLRDARVVPRAQAEYRAGRVQADVFQNSIWGSQELFEQGLLGPYKSPEREGVSEWFMDKDGYWTNDYVVMWALAFNTKLVPPNKIPRSYQDLLDPFWKNKIGVSQDSGLRWSACMLKILGEEKGRIFMKKLSQQNISPRAGMPLVAQLIAAGELAAGINLNYKDIEALKKAGAPIESVIPIDHPILTNYHVITFAKNGPHPNAAKLYIDFILSKEGQQLTERLNNIPVRADVPSSLLPRLGQGPDGKKLNFFSYDLEFVRRVNSLQKDKEFIQLLYGSGK